MPVAGLLCHSWEKIGPTSHRDGTLTLTTAVDSAPRTCRDVTSTGPTGVRRFQAVCVVTALLACVPYLWVLWDLWNGSLNPLRVNGTDRLPMYDEQARAIMHGHLWVPDGSIGFEDFIANGHQYTYFGIFPSLLRIPVFLLTSSLDDRFFGLSIFGAWIATAVFCALLLWRLRIVLRGEVELGWLEAATYGVLLAAILVGSVLIYLASRPDTFDEDEAWSVALACGSLFALVGIVERPSWRRIILCGVLVLLTNLNRSTTGYAAILATLLIAGWFGLGRAGPDRRSWAIPLMAAGLVPLVVGCFIDEAKFGLLFGAPFSKQQVYQFYHYGRVNGGQYISLHWLPDTLRYYIDPANFGVTSVFPYIVLPEGGPAALFGGDLTANVPLSAPLLVVSGFWGVVTAFARGRPKEYGALRLLLIASASTIASMMVFGWIFERFTADFLPFLILAAMIGLIDVWRRMGRAPRRTRAVVPTVAGVLALFGFWANVAFAITPAQYWNSTQTGNYIDVQRTFSDVTGHPLDSKVIVGSRFPSPASAGTIFVKGRCQDMYLSFKSIPKNAPIPGLFDLPVERAFDAPICKSLVGPR